MSDEFIRKVDDLYYEHELHYGKPEPKCSECWYILRNHTCPSDIEECPVCKLFANSED